MEKGNIKVIEPTDDYKRIHKSIIRNSNIDCETLGLYTKIVLLGTEFKLNIKGLSTMFGMSDNKVRKSIGILEKEGYIKRTAIYQNNRLNGWSYEVYPEPLDVYQRSNAGYATICSIASEDENFSVAQKQSTLETVNTGNGEDNNNRLNKHIDLINNKKEDINISSKKVVVDCNLVVETWNEYNGKKLGMVTKLTERRKKAIHKAIVDNQITQEELMRFFKSLPYADRWLYEHKGEHKNWKPDFDWWMANTNGWLTKALEGKVHKEKQSTFTSIMSGGGATYQPNGRNVFYDEAMKMYCYDGDFDFGSRNNIVYDGYEDNERPNGAMLELNNGRGFIQWDSDISKWNNKLL